MLFRAVTAISGRARHFLFFGLLSVLLAACGGGGGGGTAGSSTIVNSWGKDATSFFQGTGSRGGNAGAGGAGANGGAGDGAPIRLADVTITDSTSPTAQSVTVKTDIDGYYQANITGFKAPLIAKIEYTDAAGAKVTRYSPSVSTPVTNGFVTINITGLTTYLAAQVAIAAGGSGAEDLTPAMLADPSSTLAAETSKLRDFLNTNLTADLKAEITGYGLTLSTFNPITAVYIPATNSGYDTILENVSATTPTNTATALVLKTPLQLAKAMFAELRTTWGTALNPAATTINDFLLTQTAQTKADVNSVVQPNLSKVQGRFMALMQAMQFFDDGKANIAGLTSGTVPFGGDASGNGLIRTYGLVSSVWAGTGNYFYCWTDAAAGLTTYARCFSAGTSSADIPNNRIKGILYELTSTATNQYSFKAFRYNWAVTGGGTATTGIPSLVTADTVGNTMPSGSGTVSKTTSGTTITSLNVNGSFPPSATLNDAGQVLTTGVDNVNVNAVRTALTAANNYHYALNGSISTSKLAAGTSGAVDSTKLVTASFDTGSYIDSDETNAATGNSKALGAKIIGTIKTLATQFSGTFDLSSPLADADGLNYAATHVVFNGDISNLTGANVGKFLTGKLDVVINNYGSYHSTQLDTATNYAHGVATFTGTLQAPSRPLMTVSTTITKTSPTASTATMKYSYGLDVEVNGTTSTDSASAAKPVLTLTNQNGVQIVLDTTAYTGPVTVPTISGTTVWGNIAGGVVNYTDGATESFN